MDRTKQNIYVARDKIPTVVTKALIPDEIYCFDQVRDVQEFEKKKGCVMRFEVYNA